MTREHVYYVTSDKGSWVFADEVEAEFCLKEHGGTLHPIQIPRNKREMVGLLENFSFQVQLRRSYE